MRKILMVWLFLCAVTLGYAQERIITGKIVDKNGNGIPGVNVLIKGSTTGVVSDFEGNYQLKVNEEGGTIVYSFIGFKTQEIEIGSNPNINLTLEDDAEELSELVVTALGISREKKALGYSVQQIDGSQLSEVKDVNVVNSLAGKVAGVQINGSPGNFGGSSRITIRGITSITGNNNPLFVVDGTPIDNSNFNTAATQRGSGGTDFGNAAQDINPEDIESMSVLKGASAVALYGSRAANGVILITTKSGSKQKGIGINFGSGLTVDRVAILPNYQNEYGGGYKTEFDEFVYDETKHPTSWKSYDGQKLVNYLADESWGPRLDGTPVRQWYSWFEDDPDYGKLTPFSPHPNNIRDFYETGLKFNNHIALDGGNDKNSFRVSYTNLRLKGTIPNSKMTRHSASLSGSSKLTDKLSVNSKVNYVRSDTYGRPATGYGGSGGQANVVTSFNQWFQRQLNMDKLRFYKDKNGKDRTWNITSPSNPKPKYWENPFWVINESPTIDYRERVFGHFALSYELAEGLTAQGFARTDFYTDRREQRTSSFSLSPDKYSEQVISLKENNYEFLLQYVKNIGDDWSFSGNFGTNHRKFNFHDNKAETIGGLSVPYYYNINASIDRPLIVDQKKVKVVNSIYGSANIGFKRMLFLDLSLRNDVSSSLPIKNNSYLYPSVTGSFVFSEGLDLPWLSLGKIRGAWAQIGNDTDPYRLSPVYQADKNYGSNPSARLPVRLNNPNLKPELTTSFEIGFETSLFVDRVGLDVTYYTNKATDQIIDLPVSNTTGFSYIWINAGQINSSGIELMLSGTPIKTSSGFQWNVNINWGSNTSRVIKLTDGVDNYLLDSWGVSVNAKIGQKYGMLNGNKFKYKDGKKLVDANGYFMLEEKVDIGSYMPDWTGGISNSVTYKSFSFSGLIDFQKGGKLYSVTNRYGQYSGLLQETVGKNDKGNPIRDPVAKGGGIRADGVKEDGSPNDVYIEAQDYFKSLRLRHEAYIYDASYVKLRELRLAYQLPKSLYSGSPFTSISVAFFGRNLAILHRNIPNVDPESALGSGNVQGFENGQHPSPRSIGFNVNLKL